MVNSHIEAGLAASTYPNHIEHLDFEPTAQQHRLPLAKQVAFLCRHFHVPIPAVSVVQLGLIYSTYDRVNSHPHLCTLATHLVPTLPLRVPYAAATGDSVPRVSLCIGVALRETITTKH
jgi:hypothetical protein